MLFNSFLFLLAFLPVVVAGYWALAGLVSVAASILGLAVASYLFYLSGETVYPWLLAGSILFNFVVGKQIARAEGTRRRHWLILGVAGDLAALGFFKYSNFLVAQLAAAGLPHPDQWAVILPIGISFFTFTQIAYLADVAARKTESPDIVRYGLFVSYFPHLIAGPILHNKEMLPQFEAPDRRNVGLNLYAGLAMLAIGLAKKVLLADPCGGVASTIFGDANPQPGFFVAWIGAIAYSLQIYFDFSGYSDMAIGISRMLGIDLPINFNSPYKARSIIDFWRRWHITLSRFLRDYLYIPLGGNRRGEPRRFLNLFVTMLLGGIWHGAGWTFVIWGALHGAAQTLAHGWTALSKRVPLPRIPFLAGWLATILFVIFAWVPFRATGVTATIGLWRGMIGLNGFAVPSLGPVRLIRHWVGETVTVDFRTFGILTIAVAALVALAAPNSQQLLAKFGIGLDSPGYGAHGRPSRFALTLSWVSVLFISLLLGLSLRSIGGYSEFIYFQF